MLSIGLKGRLGNQLFQIIHGASVSAQTGYPFLLNNWEHRKSFKYFNSENVLFRVSPPGPTDILISQFNGKYEYRTEPQGDYSVIPPPISDGITAYDGYFQSEKYFGKYAQEIKELLTPVDEIKNHLDEVFKDLTDCCGIHVRRTDYLNLEKYHPVMGLDYYEKAVRLVEGKIFIIFSDDPEWAKNVLEPAIRNWIPGVVVKQESDLFSNPDPATLLFAMARCKDFIVANSSLSWLGAWLGPPGKKIFPKKWFGSGYPPVTEDRYPQGAIVV